MFRLSSLRNYRASESRAEFTPAMPSAADNARSERVAEARVSRSLRWLTRSRAVRTIIYKRGEQHPRLFCFDCEPRAVVRVRVRRCVIRVRINETVVRIRIVTATTNHTAMETLYLLQSYRLRLNFYFISRRPLPGGNRESEQTHYRVSHSDVFRFRFHRFTQFRFFR